MNAFDFWAGMWKSGAAMVRTSTRFAETMHASQAVIDSRSRTIAAASHNPLTADHAELGRMIPEKMTAFSKAGASALADWQAMQADALANWQQIIGIMAQG